LKKKKCFLYQNRIMSSIVSYSGFQKLLYFFVSAFIFIPVYTIDEYFNSPEQFNIWEILTLIATMYMLNTIGYLFISFQVQWKEKTRNLIANIFSIVLLLFLIEVIIGAKVCGT
jgi:hypothetical protein